MIPLFSPDKASIPTAIALGSFDGLHAGHRRVIEMVTKEGPGIPSVVSFWPHPREVLHGEPRLRLDLPTEKTFLLKPLGVEQLILIPFDLKFAALRPEEFVEKVLLQTLKVKRIAVGENFRFGCNREGDAFSLQKQAESAGVEVSVIPILADEEGRMSSSRIRSALKNGDLKEAQNLMGRPYQFRGIVKKGRGIGKTIGWPTANLMVDGRKFLPGLGVYASLVWVKDFRDPFSAIMNLGPQPTVDPDSPSAVEVHLLNQDLDLNNNELIVQPVQRLRSQKRFENIDELSKQILADAKSAEKVLTTYYE